MSRDKKSTMEDLLGLKKKQEHIVPNFPEFDRLFMSLEYLKKLEQGELIED